LSRHGPGKLLTKGHSGKVHDLAFAPSNPRFLATAGQDKLMILKLAGGGGDDGDDEPLSEEPNIAATTSSAPAELSSTCVAILDAQQQHVSGAGTGRGAGISRLVWQPKTESPLLAVLHDGVCVDIIDGCTQAPDGAETATAVVRYRCTDSTVTDIAFTPSGSFVLMACEGGSVKICALGATTPTKTQELAELFVYQPLASLQEPSSIPASVQRDSLAVTLVPSNLCPGCFVVTCAPRTGTFAISTLLKETSVSEFDKSDRQTHQILSLSCTQNAPSVGTWHSQVTPGGAGVEQYLVVANNEIPLVCIFHLSQSHLANGVAALEMDYLTKLQLEAPFRSLISIQAEAEDDKNDSLMESATVSNIESGASDINLYIVSSRKIRSCVVRSSQIYPGPVAPEGDSENDEDDVSGTDSAGVGVDPVNASQSTSESTPEIATEALETPGGDVVATAPARTAANGSSESSGQSTSASPAPPPPTGNSFTSLFGLGRAGSGNSSSSETTASAAPAPLVSGGQADASGGEAASGSPPRVAPQPVVGAGEEAGAGVPGVPPLLLAGGEEGAGAGLAREGAGAGFGAGGAGAPFHQHQLAAMESRLTATNHHLRTAINRDIAALLNPLKLQIQESDRVRRMQTQTSDQHILTTINQFGGLLGNQTKLMQDMARKNEAYAYNLQSRLLPNMQEEMAKGFAVEMEKILPQVENQVKQQVEEALQGVIDQLPEKLEASINSTTSAVVEAVREPVEDVFRKCFADQVIPGFGKATNGMFQQMGEFFKTSIESALEKSALESAPAVDGKLEALQKQMDDMQKLVSSLHEENKRLQKQITTTSATMLQKQNTLQTTILQQETTIQGQFEAFNERQESIAAVVPSERSTTMQPPVQQSETSAPAATSTKKKTRRGGRGRDGGTKGQPKDDSPATIEDGIEDGGGEDGFYHVADSFAELVSDEDAPRNSRASSDNPFPPPEETSSTAAINDFLAKGDIEPAFLEALEAGDIGLTLWLCGEVGCDAVFHDNEGSILQQSIVLCLIQQLGFNISDMTAFKLTWLKRAVPTLDLSDDTYKEHALSLLVELKDSLQDSYSQFNENDYNSARRVLQLTSSHIMMNS
jgi:hypothetical protein